MPDTGNNIILLVEDNASDVELARLAFNRANISGKFVVAGDGVEAIEYLFGDTRALPLLILLDLKLPRMDGFAVLERIRRDERTRRIPVVIVTTSNDEETIARSYSAGANDFIRKSPGFREFSETLSKTVRKWMPERDKAVSGF
jgi:two-component system response regulator